MAYLSDLFPPDDARTEADAEGRAWFTLDPDVVYPYVLARIAEALETGVAPPAIREQLLPRARALPELAWAHAETPRDELPATISPERLADRAAALDIVRLWALELQHAACGYVSRGVHIVKRPAWRD